MKFVLCTSEVKFVTHWIGAKWLVFMQNALYDRHESLRHREEAKVGGVYAIDGAVILRQLHQFSARNHVNIFVALRNGIFVGSLDDLMAFQTIFGGHKIGSAHHDNGYGGMGFTNSMIQWLVGGQKMLGTGGVIVVIANEHGHGEAFDIVDNRRLAFGITRKAQVNIVCIKGA